MREDVRQEIQKYNNNEYLEYIVVNIMPQYKEGGHKEDHIFDVLNRAYDLNKNLKLNLDFRLLSAAAFYHDIGRKIDDEKHHIISAEIFMGDEKMKEFFNDEERIIIKEAIEDHRSSSKNKPRGVYGEVISSADRNTRLEQPFKRSFEYRISRTPEKPLEVIIQEAYDHLVKKFSKQSGYANEVYFDDGVYQKYLDELNDILESYDLAREKFLEFNKIDEMEHYLVNVNTGLIKFVEKEIFPIYSKNDLGHDLTHIKEVIRRSFELMETMHLDLDDNMVYTIAACHDVGKYIDYAIHEKIAAKMFIENKGFKQFFDDGQRKIIKEAIEDHRSSFESLPRTKYGELISSADRNTSIAATFRRSFAVGKERTPDMSYDEYLDFTIKRLSKKYDEENPENMFLIDDKYRNYLVEIRKLLKNKEKFNTRYSEVNKIAKKDYNKKLYKL